MRDQLGMSKIPNGLFAKLPVNYRQGILSCPSFNRDPVYTLEVHYGMPQYNIGGWNWTTNKCWKKVSQMTQPSNMFIFLESYNNQPAYSGNWRIDNQSDAWRDFRHQENMNIAHADGHINTYSRFEISSDSTWRDKAPMGWPK
jgi:prepilin-type processing-associated H-X9-DG protein